MRTNTFGFIVGAAIAGTLAATDAHAKTIYVSSTGSDNNDGSTAALAFRSVGAAALVTAPGDVVQVDDGTYDAFTVSIAGTASAWIRYVAKPGTKPKIQFTGWEGIFIESAQYIEIQGFDVDGPMSSETLAYCQDNAADASTTPDPLCNANGIAIDSRAVTNKAHHILIDGNEVHDCPGGGISAIEADYITIDANYVHDNCFHNRYGASGISLLTSWNFDNSTEVKSIVSRNLVFGNMNEVDWVQIGKLSDGNGIIIDTSKNSAATPPGPDIAPYTGRFLVENNVSVGNGGSGMHAYNSAHVDFFYNTTYQNGQVVGYPEIFSNTSDDVRIENNIMIGRPDGGAVNANDPSSTATYDYNVYSAGIVNSMGASDVVADPHVVSASLDPTVANFRLMPGSPAVDTANGAFPAPVDITGATRPIGAGYDRGAYELGAVLDGGASAVGSTEDASTEASSDDAGASSIGSGGGGIDGSAASGAIGASSDAGLNAGGNGEQGTTKSGCGCAAVGALGSPGATLWALFGVVAAVKRRRGSGRNRRAARHEE